ncbi:MAG TPA: class I SAM-dependent methyltransferase [Microvirga sp.]|jgi:SAM-dependent methyltransferase|nr:class I SAM-dependent methyltransferase [Microvirga sp.]
MKASNPAENLQKRVLHVGCGAATLAKLPRGFQDGSWSEVRFDINPNVRPDIIGTITDMVRVPSGSVDAVYSSHNIEHVYAHEVVPALQEFRRVLKDGGFAVITCPDLQAVAEHMRDGNLFDPIYSSPAGPISPVDILYGHRASIARGETYMAHRTGFSLKTLTRCCVEAGFGSFFGRRHVSRLALWLLATKQVTPSADLKQLFAAYAS